ncbi:trigger factor [candidate division WOR-3 bacterium]|nr:trigger factor [candidate division WOR-3 bacterium]
MKVVVEKASSVKRNLQIEESSEIIDREEKKIIAEIAANRSFPGFRKGKVPLSIVRKMFGDDIAETSLNSAIENLSRNAIEQENLKPLGRIEEKNVKIENGMLSFTITFEVLPEIEEVPLESIEVDKPVYSASEMLVKERLDLIRERSSFLSSVERVSKKDDFVQCDFTVRDESGETVSELSFKDRMIGLNENAFWKGFYENLTDRKKGENFTFEFTVPEDDSKYGGKKLVFGVEIKEIKEKTLPELDDDLAKEFNYSDIAEMKNDVEKKLEEDVAVKSEADFENNILKILEESYSFEVPSTLVENEIENMLDLLTKHLKIDKSRETLRSEIEDSARKRAKQNIILDHLSEKHGIEIPDEELRENLIMAISNEVGYDKLSRPAIKNKLDDPEFVKDVYWKVKRRKTLEKIKELITVKEVRENEPE